MSKKSKRNIQVPIRSQMRNFQLIGIGEISKVLILQVSIEIRVTVDLATPFHSLKSSSKDLE